ncbi:MAG: hypothetical protein WCB48_12345 [Casimicrobiaceae bacterium]
MLGLSSDDVTADPLGSPEAAEALWLSVGHAEPLAAVRAICDALAASVERRTPHIDRVRSLFVVDRHAQLLLERLLLRLASTPVDAPAQERQLRHAVFELCRALAQGYHQFLQQARSSWFRNDWRDAVPAILVRLFYHRQVELLLHLFRYEPWPHGRWRETHDIYGWWRRIAPPAHAGNGRDAMAMPPTPDGMYARMLLVQRLDCGQFTAPELAFARRRIARWSGLVSLSPLATSAPMPRNAFVVDLAGADGLRRASGALDHGRCLWLDTAPIATAVRQELDEMRGSSSSAHGGRSELLSRLGDLFAPSGEPVERRGARSPVALTSVQATVGGLASIFAMLRTQSKLAAPGEAHGVPARLATPATGTGPASVDGSMHSGVPDDASSRFPSTASFGVPQLAWQVRDRSESGSRLRGRVSNPRRTMPGSLMAFREDDGAPWTLAIVRRLARLPGSNVQVGVEHLGRDPQPLVLAPMDSATGPGATQERFPALYLRDCAIAVRRPTKALVVPAACFERGRIFTAISTTRETSVRLGEAIEHRDDFVLAPFEVAATPRVS